MTIRRFFVRRRYPGGWMWITYHPGSIVLERWPSGTSLRTEYAAEVYRAGDGLWYWRPSYDCAREYRDGSDALLGHNTAAGAMIAATWNRLVLAEITSGMTATEREEMMLCAARDRVRLKGNRDAVGAAQTGKNLPKKDA